MSFSSTYASAFFIALAFGCFDSSLAYAEDIADLFPTGVDENGKALSEGQKDSHYTVQNKAATVWVDEEDDPATKDVDENAGDPVWNQWAGPELGDAKSSWISTEDVFSKVPSPTDVFSFKTSFTIPEGTKLENVRIKMTYAVDNTLLLFLNDEEILEDKLTTVREFRSVFEITGEKHADILKIGKNTLIFEARNTETDTVNTPLGIRVQFITKTLGEAKKCNPLAQSFAMLGNPGFWQGVDDGNCETVVVDDTAETKTDAEASTTALRPSSDKGNNTDDAPAAPEGGCSVNAGRATGLDWGVGLMVMACVWMRRRVQLQR